MGLGRLSELQSQVLSILASSNPPWTLTGGGALVGIHTLHRTTRDLDLFFHGRRELGGSPREAEERLVAEGLEVHVIQRTSTFCRLRVAGPDESVIVDLVAEPVPTVEPPLSLGYRGVTIQVDSPHEILVNKLCALLSRSEVRDLQDVKALLDAGGELERALADAPRKDGGFSPLTLAWILETFSLPALASRDGLSQAEIRPLDQFREELLARITTLAVPD